MTNRISIIIISFNGLSFLKKCLPTIYNQSYPDIEIVLVDNNSSDGTEEYISENYPKILLIQNKENEGFAKANNIGVEKASGEFIFLLNNDTELFPDTIEKIINAYRPRSVLTAYQISTRAKDQPGRTGSGMDIFGYPFFDHKHPEKTKLFYADGAAMFLSKQDFEDIGGFDEALYMFQEDIDFSWKARIMGYQIIPVPDAKLYHYYGGTAALENDKKTGYTTSYFRRYLNERNIIRNMLKNYSPLFLIPISFILIIFHIVEIVALLLIGKWKVVQCYLMAYGWNISNIQNTLSIRKDVQKKRIVSDFRILQHMYVMYAKFRLLLLVGTPKFI